MTEQYRLLHQLWNNRPWSSCLQGGSNHISWLKNEDVMCQKKESNWASVGLNQTLESHDTPVNIYTTGAEGMLLGQQAQLLLH